MLAMLNLGLKFLLEVSAVGAFVFWGANTGEMPLNVVLAIVVPLLAVASWGVLAAPKSARRLPLQSRVPFEVTFFAAAVFALLAAGAPGAAAIMAALVVLNAALLTALGQWER